MKFSLSEISSYRVILICLLQFTVPFPYRREWTSVISTIDTHSLLGNSWFGWVEMFRFSEKQYSVIYNDLLYSWIKIILSEKIKYSQLYSFLHWILLKMPYSSFCLTFGWSFTNFLFFFFTVFPPTLNSLSFQLHISKSNF